MFPARLTGIFKSENNPCDFGHFGMPFAARQRFTAENAMATERYYLLTTSD
jgi:hypothetical protein